MKEIDPGHKYSLQILDEEDDCSWEHITFVKREGPDYPGNSGSWPGTTSQDIMRVLIARAKYVNRQKPHQVNELVVGNLRDCIWAFEERAAQQHNRTLPERHTVRYDVEHVPTCGKCGHIFCEHIGFV